MRLLIDSSLPLIEEAFPAPFIITKYGDNKEVQALLPRQDILVCRSTLCVNESLLQNSSLRYILTASSGTDHIDKTFLKAKKIQLLDARGSNARSVADYVLATLAALKAEAIPIGKKAGIIGLGAVGMEVYAYLSQLGYQVETYDPLRALYDNTFTSCTLDALADCALICIHPELHDDPPYPSRNLIDAKFLEKLKKGTVLINAARGGIVNEEALLNFSKKFIYCTDVYLNEPAINSKIVAFSTLCTPHIAGHSIEAKTGAVYDLSIKLHQSLQLNSPVNVKMHADALRKVNNLAWEKEALTLYDPRRETKISQENTVDETLFLSLRKQHYFRHDFQFSETKGF